MIKMGYLTFCIAWTFFISSRLSIVIATNGEVKPPAVNSFNQVSAEEDPSAVSIKLLLSCSTLKVIFMAFGLTMNNLRMNNTTTRTYMYWLLMNRLFFIYWLNSPAFSSRCPLCPA